MEGIKEDIQTITKTAAAAEVLKQLIKFKQLTLVGVIISLLTIVPSLFGPGTAFIIVGAGCIAFGYFYINNEKEIKRIKEKYKL